MKRITWTGDDTLVYTEDAPPPSPPGNGEALVKVTAVGLCGTDVHIIRGLARFRDPPHVLGHEVAGIVVETGGSEGAQARNKGDRRFRGRVRNLPVLPARRDAVLPHGL